MEHVHSIILIKKGDKYLNYFDERWGMYLFPNIKGNDIEEIKDKYNTNNVKYLFDKVHEKYSIPNKEQIEMCFSVLKNENWQVQFD